jgi:hypothetical protein
MSLAIANVLPGAAFWLDRKLSQLGATPVASN